MRLFMVMRPWVSGMLEDPDFLRSFCHGCDNPYTSRDPGLQSCIRHDLYLRLREVLYEATQRCVAILEERGCPTRVD